MASIEQAADADGRLSAPASRQVQPDHPVIVGTAEQQYHLLADTMPQIVWTARPDGWIDYYNRRWFEYTGMTYAQTQGWGWELVIHPDDLQHCLDRWSEAVRTGGDYQIEYRFKREDGVYRWHLGRAVALCDAEGRIAKWVGTSTDIEDQKRAEAERDISLARDHAARATAEAIERRTRDVLDALLAMAEAAVATVADAGAESDSGEHLQAHVNTAGGRLAELTRQVLGCRHVAILAVEPGTETLEPVAIAGFSADERDRWWRQWDSRPGLHDRITEDHIARLKADEPLLLDRTQPPFSSETAFGRRLVLMMPLRVGAGLCGVLSVDYGEVVHPYTPDEVALIRAVGRLVALAIERERLIDGWAAARASALALGQANRRMEEFLSIAGHELRTPLTSILGNLQLATRWVDDALRGSAGASIGAGGIPETRLPGVRTLLARIERQARLLNRLVQDVLDAVRLQSGRLQVHAVPCDLATLVRDVVQEQRQLAEPRAILLDPDTPASVPVAADADRIAQVLTNYLSNALRYSGGDRPVTVGIVITDPLADSGQVPAARQARVWVRDEGEGLPLEEQEQIWDRFYRSAGVSHRSGSSVGLGLGLAISRGIVERHQGRVGVESAPGAGATFWFTLPLAGS
jgi:PAS domain S-box-containing protein